MKQTNSCFKKVIWAIEPYSMNRNLLKKTISMLKMLIRDKNACIQPLVIYSQYKGPNFLDVATSSKSEFPFKKDSQLREKLQSIGLVKVKEPVILYQEGPYQIAPVDLLLSYCIQHEANLIVVTTHARRGIERMALGSFSERLLDKGDIPLLVIGPKTSVGKQFKNLLFPTDFSERSLECLDSAIDLAKALKLNLTIYHRPLLGFPSIAPAFSNSASNQFKVDRKCFLYPTAEKWEKYAKARGVQTHTVFDETRSPVHLGILHHLRKLKGAIIAMPTFTGPIAATFLGSTTRQVLRMSPVPVWILKPRSGRRQITSQRKKVA